MNWTEINTDINLLYIYDKETERIRVLDTYGEFIPFPINMWAHCVERPWLHTFQYTQTSLRRVIDIFLGEYQHRYICNN